MSTKAKPPAKRDDGPWEDGPLPDVGLYSELSAIYQTKRNKLYCVLFSDAETACGTVLHLWIRNKHGGPIAWAEKQRIKDELVGAERVAVEVFPARSRLVDSAPMYHLWVLPEGYELPFGLRR